MIEKQSSGLNSQHCPAVSLILKTSWNGGMGRGEGRERNDLSNGKSDARNPQPNNFGLLAISARSLPCVSPCGPRTTSTLNACYKCRSHLQPFRTCYLIISYTHCHSSTRLTAMRSTLKNVVNAWVREQLTARCRCGDLSTRTAQATWAAAQRNQETSVQYNKAKEQK